MNHHARGTLIARSGSNDSHQHLMTTLHVDMRKRTRHVLRGILLLFALSWMVFAEDGFGSPEEMRKRITDLELELAVLRTQALPFKNMVELKLRLSSGSSRWVRTEAELAKQVPVHLPHAMVLFLGLSDAELVALSVIVRDTNQRLAEEIAKQRPTLVRITKCYRLEIRSFIIEGRLIEDDFLKRSEEVLGSDRLALWRAHVGNEWFFHFGQATYTYTLFSTEDQWGKGHVLIREYDTAQESSVGSHRPAQFTNDAESDLMGEVRTRFGYDFFRPYLPDDLIREFAAERRAQLQWFADQEAARERKKPRELIKADDVKDF